MLYVSESHSDKIIELRQNQAKNTETKRMNQNILED